MSIDETFTLDNLIYTFSTTGTTPLATVTGTTFSSDNPPEKNTINLPLVVTHQDKKYLVAGIASGIFKNFQNVTLNLPSPITNAIAPFLLLFNPFQGGQGNVICVTSKQNESIVLFLQSDSAFVNLPTDTKTEIYKPGKGSGKFMNFITGRAPGGQTIYLAAVNGSVTQVGTFDIPLQNGPGASTTLRFIVKDGNDYPVPPRGGGGMDWDTNLLIQILIFVLLCALAYRVMKEYDMF